MARVSRGNRARTGAVSATDTATRPQTPAQFVEPAHAGSEERIGVAGGDAGTAGDRTGEAESAARTLVMAEFATAPMPEQPEPDEAGAADPPNRADPPEPTLQGFIDQAN